MVDGGVTVDRDWWYNWTMTDKPNDVDMAADLLLSELGDLFSRSDDELEELREELRDDNDETIAVIDWDKLDKDAVLNHPDVRDFMLAHLQGLIDHLTYMK